MMDVSAILDGFLLREGVSFRREGDIREYRGLICPQNPRGGSFGREVPSPLGTGREGGFLLALSPAVPLREGDRLDMCGEVYAVDSLCDTWCRGKRVLRRALLHRCAEGGLFA